MARVHRGTLGRDDRLIVNGKSYGVTMRQPDNAVTVSVCEAELPILAITLQRPVAAGQLLRLRASGAYMLMGAAVLTVTPDGRPALPVLG